MLLRRRARAAGWVTIAALCTGGCAQYQPLQLDAAAVNGRLAARKAEELTTQAARLDHPLLKPLVLRPADGLTPESAAVLAVLVNPSLRAARDRRGLVRAQLTQAGLLPNPQLAYNYDFVTGGNTAGTVNAYGLGLSWNVTALLTRQAKVDAATAAVDAANLDIAWQEWQVAEAAKSAVYDLVSLRAQAAVAGAIDQRLQANLDVVRHAVDAGLQSIVDLAAAESAARDARAAVLQIDRDADHALLQLRRAMGLPANADIRLRDDLAMPARFDPPRDAMLADSLEQRRIDLAGLRRGYDSQDQTLRAAILAQFPQITLGIDRASDTTNVHTLGPAITIDLPIFDRNQAAIAAETSTRQRLFDEYVARVFDARADIAAALADIRHLNEQIADADAAVPNLQRLVDVYKQAAEHGNADVLSYYAAWNNLAGKQLDALRLKQQLAAARVALEIAAAMPFADDATAPASQPAAVPTVAMGSESSR